jgi:hypothetical protein
MRKPIGIFLAVVGLLAGLAMSVPAEAATITIGSFDGTRSVAPFATASGPLGYGRLRSSLLDPAKFGPGGTVNCNVVIAPGTPTITAAYLAGKNVFFTSVFTGDLSASEATAINAFVAGGGVVIVDANSVSSEQTAANSLLAAIGTAAATGPALGCPNLATGGTITASANVVTNGPFGNVAGGTFGTSISSVATLDGREQTLVTCPAADVVRAFFAAGAISAGSGLVMYGGDPSAYDLFTDPSGVLFNADNEVIYLNAIATACAGGEVSALSPAHVWVGLKNSDDQGTQFDLRVELLKNGTPVASGLTRCVTGVTRNPTFAKEVVIPFDAFAPEPVASGDVLSLRVSTRIGTIVGDTKCAGPGGSHNNARGLRLYYDSTGRPSRFDVTIAPNPNEDLYLHSDGGNCPNGDGDSPGVTTRFLDSTPPTSATPKCKDSLGLNFNGGNPYAVIGTWSLAPLP